MKKLKSDKGSTERFGFEWDRYTRILPEYEEQFLKWVYPLKKEDFKGKSVLDAGCGIGRNSFWPLKYKAKRVIAFDYDERTVKRAKENLKKFNNCKVKYGSIYDIEFNEKFDIVFSIGVIHHLEFPHKAIENLIKALKPNGILLIWVYGYEGNEWIVRYVNPIRKITSKLPLSITKMLSSLLTVPLYTRIKLFEQKQAYMKQISKFNFKHLELIVLDQLIPKIANYWRKEQAINLLDRKGLKNVNIHRVNNNSWTIMAKK